MNFVQIAEFDWLPWQYKGLIFEKILKNLSETVRGMKLKLCIHVHDISLYINYVFIVVAPALSLLWQLLSFHRFIMGKDKVGLYF